MYHQKNKLYWNLLIFCLLLLVASDSVHAGSFARTQIRFQKEAAGGTLVFSDAWNPYPISAEINTVKGENPEAVLKKLQIAISKAWGWEDGVAVVQDGMLDIPRMDYVLAGTETGLGIPEAPHSLTIGYDSETRSFNLNWKNSDTYDYIVATGDPFGKKLEGDRTSCTFTVTPDTKRDNEHDDIWFCVYGVKNNLPSSPNVVAWNNCKQIENLGYEGANGVLPNWERWTSTEQVSSQPLVTTISSSVKGKKVGGSNPRRNKVAVTIKNNSSKPAGIMRRFTGLTPDHVYKLDMEIQLSVNSLSPDTTSALYIALAPKVTHGAENNDLTAKQTDGEFDQIISIPLTDQPNAIGSWEKLSSLKPDPLVVSPTQSHPDILVWLECASSQGGGISISGLTLTDLNCDD